MLLIEHDKHNAKITAITKEIARLRMLHEKTYKQAVRGMVPFSVPDRYESMIHELQTKLERF